MSRDEQIEEMAKDINVADHEYCNGRCLGCEHKARVTEDYTCVDIAIATALVTKGYRKSTDLAEEIFAEIRRIGGCSAGVRLNWWDIAELEKKYTEGRK